MGDPSYCLSTIRAKYNLYTISLKNDVHELENLYKYIDNLKDYYYG